MNNIFLSILIMLTFAAMVLPYPGTGATEAYAFDREACYSTCGCTISTFQTCMACRQECDRKYWQSFDRQMNDLGKSRSYQSNGSQR